MLGACVTRVRGNDVAGSTQRVSSVLDHCSYHQQDCTTRAVGCRRIVWRMHTGNGGLRVYGSMTTLSGSPLRHGLWSLGATIWGRGPGRNRRRVSETPNGEDLARPGSDSGISLWSRASVVERELVAIVWHRNAPPCDPANLRQRTRRTSPRKPGASRRDGRERGP
jgi:hypothetical protein